MRSATLFALGVRVRLEADDPAWLEALLDRVPRSWRQDRDPRTAPDLSIRWHSPEGHSPEGHSPEGHSPEGHSPEGHGPGGRRPAFRLLLGGRIVAAARQARDLLDRFEHELPAAVASRTRYVVVHAGVVVHGGRAILLPGPSFAGKSTLVYALVKKGGTYYSDDLAALDSSGRVHAVPKRLALRQGARRGRAIPAHSLGWEPDCPPRPVRLVLLARYRPGSRFAPRRLTPGEGVLALFRHTITASEAPENALRILTQIAATTPVLAGDRGAADAVAESILRTAEAS